MSGGHGLPGARCKVSPSLWLLSGLCPQPRGSLALELLREGCRSLGTLSQKVKPRGEGARWKDLGCSPRADPSRGSGGSAGLWVVGCRVQPHGQAPLDSQLTCPPPPAPSEVPHPLEHLTPGSGSMNMRVLACRGCAHKGPVCARPSSAGLKAGVGRTYVPQSRTARSAPALPLPCSQLPPCLCQGPGC